MTTITLNAIEPQLAQRLQQRADHNGRSIEAEISAILFDALTSEHVEEQEDEENEVDLYTAIRRRLAPVGGIDLPELPREPMRTPPSKLLLQRVTSRILTIFS